MRLTREKKGDGYRKLGDFLVEAENLLAYEIAQQLIRSAKVPYNPISLFGPTGSGKTHLLEAIVHGLRKNFPRDTVLFVNALEFYYDYVASLRQNEWQNFRSYYRNGQILVVDDLQNLENKQQTQQQLLFLINELILRERLVITSSQVNPRELKEFNFALINRLECGLPIKIKPLSRKRAAAHCLKMAQKMEVDLSPEMISLVLREYKGSFGTFRENFERLLFFCARNNHKVTLTLLQGFFHKYHQRQTPLDQQEILAAVAKHYQVHQVAEITHKKGRRSSLAPRYVAISLSKALLARSNQQLCKVFGDCSESTIRYALNKVKDEKKLWESYLLLKEKLEPR